MPNRIVLLIITAAFLLAGCSARLGQATLPTVLPTATPTRPAAPTSAPSATVAPAPTVMPMATAAPSPTFAPTVAPTATTLACTEEQGQIVHGTITSAALGKEQNYRIFLPPCYSADSSRRYPVIYLLHGAGHDDGYWDSLGVDEAADPLIASGDIPPVIIVLPDGNRTFGLTRGAPPPFAGFLLNELIPHIDASYRTLAERDHRAIGGISLGGAWALTIASQHPDAFGAVGGHSPAIGALNHIWPDVAALAASKMRVFLDAGANDSLAGPTGTLDRQLTDAHVDHVFHIYPGRHEEVYWTSHLEEYLRFYTAPWGSGRP